MTRSECFSLTINVFQEYYRQVTLNQDYVFSFDKLGRKEKTVNKFLDYLDKKYGLKSIGLNFLVNFIESGFNLYYDSKHLKFGTSSIQIEWIIGGKAIERYEKIKDIDNKYYSKHRKIRKEFTLRVIDKFRSISIDNVKSINTLLTSGNVDFYELEKQRFYNTPEGLIWCTNNTTLYNHSSTLCEGCENRTKCKEILRINYPKLYNKRGYGGN